MRANPARRILVASAAILIGAPVAQACSDLPACVPIPGCMLPRIVSNVKTGPSLPASGSLAFSSWNVSLLSQVPLPQMGGVAGTTGSSLYAWVDPLTNREYALMGRSNGTAIIDVTNPTNPQYVANVPIASGSVATEWREPKVYGNYAYIGVDGTSHPIQVVDLTQVRSYVGSTLTLAASSFRGIGNTLTKAHTLAINPDTGYLYAARTNKYSGGVMAIDVRNPANPVEVGGFSGDGLTHETQVVIYNGPDTQYRGREIAFNSNAKSSPSIDTFSIVDLTNKASPTRLSSKTYTNARWIHQGWLTEDHRYFIQNDESDEAGGVTGGHTRTHLWDVADLDNPVYRGFYDHATTSVDHNLYVKGDYVYMTNYTTGLRILKLGDLSSTNPQNWMEEVAFFDTYPLNDGTTFNGAWNNYPFLPSGNILVSDIDGGLFVLRADLPAGPVFGPQPVPWNQVPAVPEPSSAIVLAIGAMLMHRRSR